jgi:hypothetical protein
VFAAANLDKLIALWKVEGCVEEDERAIMGLVAIVGFVLVWILLEEFGYFGLLTFNK